MTVGEKESKKWLKGEVVIIEAEVMDKLGQESLINQIRVGWIPEDSHGNTPDSIKLVWRFWPCTRMCFDLHLKFSPLLTIVIGISRVNIIVNMGM